MDGALFLVIAVLLGLILVSQIALWAVQYQVVKQQGRLLLRLDELARPSLPAANALVQIPQEVDSRNARVAQPMELPVGTAIAPFHLPDLAGRLVDLGDFRGKRVLLIHWSPECGFCDLIAPDLAKLQAVLQRRQVQVVLVSYGTVEANQRLAKEHNLACPILLQEESQPLELFRNLGTPVSYLLDEQGRVTEPLAVGADQVLNLARAAAAVPEGKSKRLPGERPLNESRIEREGLKVGTLAPPFTLTDVRGGFVTLETYRGRRVLLVFTDPHCGPCDALAPYLVQLHRAGQHSRLSLVMVAHGEMEENRRKAEQHGFEFPVALQRWWEVSKAYGIFATPVGFMIDERGVLVKDVARGADAIVALAREELAIADRKEQVSG